MFFTQHHRMHVTFTRIHSLQKVVATHGEPSVVLGLCSLDLIKLVLCVKPATEAHPVTDHPPLGQNIWITQCPGIVISARPPRCVNNTCLLFAYKTTGRQSCEQRDVAITSTDVSSCRLGICCICDTPMLLELNWMLI